MMNDHNLSGPKQLLRDDQGPQGFNGPATSISDDVRIALLESKNLCRILYCGVSKQVIHMEDVFDYLV